MNPLGLSDREVLIVWAWANGRDRRWIADFVGRSPSAIESNEKQIRRKLGVHGKTHAVAIVLRAILGDAPRVSPVVVAPLVEDNRPVVSMQQLAHGARMAVRDGLDPWLALSYVMWPPESLKVAA